jgi:penicillin-binding protein 1C
MTGATARQRHILRRMVIDGRLSIAAGAEALGERLDLRREAAPFAAPHFVQRALGLESGSRPGRVVTTLDAELQREVEGIIRSHRLELDRHGANNVAVVVLDNERGEWLAWEGSGRYSSAEHGGHIDGVVTPRQPGSALKPLTYALAFEMGESPASVLPDVPSYFPTAEPGILYSPRNYDGQFRGPLLARRALAGSANVPAVVMASRVGVPALLRFLREAGLTSLENNAAHYGLGITLGDAEVRLDELVAAYAAFARGGLAVTPTLRRSADAASMPARRLVSPRTAFWITDVLNDPDAREYAFGRGGSLDFPFAVAAKTGTSQAYRDNWTIGYTKAVTVGVWVGNFDRRPLVGSSGVTGAGPIFHAVMMAAVRRLSGAVPFDRDVPTVAPPAGLQRRRLCALSGMSAGPHCTSEVEDWVPEESAGTICNWHPGEDEVVWPQEYRHWALPNRPNPSFTSASVAAVGGALEVTSPPPGATYFIDPTLRREFQTVAFRAASDSGGPIEWLVDDRLVGSSEADRPFDWPIAAGAHVISARDRHGRRAATSILVK